MYKEYYSQLIKLYESTKSLKEVDNLVDQGNPGIQQEAIPEEQPQEVPQDGNIKENPELDDASYLDDLNLSPVESIPDTSEQKRKEKMFELFKELMNYSEVFYEDLEKIDSNLLDKEKIDDLRENKNRIKTISEKLRKYIEDDFLKEKYERSLYIYILLRTELITIVKLLRHSFELNKVDKTDKKD